MSTPILNPNVQSLTAPAIPLALNWAEGYSGAYGPLIDLSQAVPNYPPHPDMLQSLAANAGSKHSAGYGAIEGEPALRSSYARHLSELYQQSLDPAHVHITSGCNQAFVATLMALTESGDQVVMTNPCYFNHEATAKMLGLQIRYLPCEEGNAFLPTVESLLPLLDSARVLALVSPNNPTGAVYPANLLQRIFDQCQCRGVWLVLDETYRDFLPAEQQPSHTLFANQNWQQTFVQLYSFSKSLCIPGHRLGAVTAGQQVIENLAKVMDNLQICAPRAAQLSTAEMLPLLTHWKAENIAEIAKRAKIFVSTMAHFPNWRVSSIGAYFAYVQHPFANTDSATVVQRLAQEFGILPLPGCFFGFAQDQFIRVAFANVNSQTIEQLGQRLLSVESDWHAAALGA